MKSSTVILSLCWVLMILHWTTDMFPGGMVPFAFCASYLIMWMFGFFKREDQIGLTELKNSDIENDLSDRQKDFIEKMRQGEEDSFQHNPDALATINMMDEDGTRSSVIIMEDGTVKTTGAPDPDIVEAAKMLGTSVLESGPEAIAEELAKQIAKMNEEYEDER